MQEVYSDPMMDFSQSHQYQNLGKAQGAPSYFDPHTDAASEVASRCVAAQSEYGLKPHYFGEFGLKKRLGEIVDKPGLSLHNAYFAALTSGCAGTPGSWWWSTYMDRLDLYSLFTPVSRFAERVDWGGLDWQPLNASGAGLRIVASYGTNATTKARTAVVWAQHVNSTWSWVNGSCYGGNAATGPAVLCNISGGDTPFPRTVRPIVRAAFSVALPGAAANSLWRVDWFDTWRGAVTASEQKQLAGGTLELEVPGALRNDTAAILTAL